MEFACACACVWMCMRMCWRVQWACAVGACACACLCMQVHVLGCGGKWGGGGSLLHWGWLGASGAATPHPTPSLWAWRRLSGSHGDAPRVHIGTPLGFTWGRPSGSHGDAPRVWTCVPHLRPPRNFASATAWLYLNCAHLWRIKKGSHCPPPPARPSGPATDPVTAAVLATSLSVSPAQLASAAAAACGGVAAGVREVRAGVCMCNAGVVCGAGVTSREVFLASTGWLGAPQSFVFVAAPPHPPRRLPTSQLVTPQPHPAHLGNGEEGNSFDSLLFAR
jgi:hypothetical protein